MLEITASGLAALGVAGMVTGHDGVISQSVIAGLLLVAGWAIGKQATMSDITRAMIELMNKGEVGQEDAQAATPVS